MTDQQFTVIRNGSVLTPSDEVKDGVVVVRGGAIADVGRRGEVREPAGAGVIDAGGDCIVPGLIDIHVHGSKGADVLDATPEALSTMSEFFVTRGVTAFAATMVTAVVSPPSRLPNSQITVSVEDFLCSTRQISLLELVASSGACGTG